MRASFLTPAPQNYLPVSLTFALTCNPWLVLGGRVPRLVVVVGVIFLTKPPLRPLLPETQEASSFRSSPVEESKSLLPKSPPHPTPNTMTFVKQRG